MQAPDLQAATVPLSVGIALENWTANCVPFVLFVLLSQPFFGLWAQSDQALSFDEDSAFRSLALASNEAVVDGTRKVEQAVMLPTLYIFSGSDWCAPCRRLERQVWSDTAWMAFAGRRLNVVVVDFPRRRTLPEAEQKQNEVLAERYNPAMLFPKLVLVAPDGSWAETIETRSAKTSAIAAAIETVLHARSSGP